MGQGGFILAAGRVGRKKKHEITGISLIIVAHRIYISTHFPGVFDAGGCFYHFFHVFPRRGALCNAATTGATYSWVSVVIMSAIKRYCRELSIGYSSLPKVGVVCEISSKEHNGSSSLLLKHRNIVCLEGEN